MGGKKKRLCSVEKIILFFLFIGYISSNNNNIRTKYKQINIQVSWNQKFEMISVEKAAK